MEPEEQHEECDSMLLDSSKAEQVPLKRTQFYQNYCEEHVSTKAEISCDLLKALRRVQHEHQKCLREAVEQERRATTKLNLQLEEKLGYLNQQNRELREMYKEVVQSRNLRKDFRLPLHSRQNSHDRMAEEFQELRMRQSLASNKSSQRPRGTMPENRRDSFRTTRNNCNKGELMSSMRRPFMSGKASLNGSFIFKREEQQTVHDDNLFLGLMNLMLEQERQYESILKMEWQESIPQCAANTKILEFEEVEKMLRQYHIRIEALMKVIEVFKKNISEAQLETDALQRLLNQFVEARDRILEITLKVRNLPQLKSQIARLNDINSIHRPSSRTTKGTDLESIKLFLTIFCDDSTEGQPTLDRIKQIDTGKLLLDKRQSKIRELVNSIREGRRKFQQIHQIYLQRIETLEQKIRQQQQ